MNPFYFGSSERALFGLYHPPRGAGRNRGVVLCNPLGEEAMRAHRAYRQLAEMLAQERYHVLRFDYFGSGDSAGDSGEGTARQWLEDIATATDELKDVSSVAKVSWVGLRYGGTLAALAARGRSDLDRLVLWDPVIDGRAYLRELRAMHLAFVRAEFASRRREMTANAAGRGEEVIGFPLSAELRGEIEAVDLAAIDEFSAKKVALIVSQPLDGQERFVDRLRASSVETSVFQFTRGGDWNSEDVFANVEVSASLVPKELLAAIVDNVG